MQYNGQQIGASGVSLDDVEKTRTIEPAAAVAGRPPYQFLQWTL